jgi:hypothetical protein
MSHCCCDGGTHTEQIGFKKLTLHEVELESHEIRDSFRAKKNGKFPKPAFKKLREISSDCANLILRKCCLQQFQVAVGQAAHKCPQSVC